MKYRLAFALTISTFFVVTPALYAQNQQAPAAPPLQQAPRSECDDGSDNDKDGKIDRSGRTFGGVVYPPDPECLASNATKEGATSTRGAAINVSIKNPLKVDTIQGALKLFMDAILRIALPFIVVFFIWSGVNMILARGNKDKLGQAKKMFWYTILGTLLILGAWTITNIIIGTVNSVTS